MPISGVVITCTAENIDSVQARLTESYASVLEIHGTDDKGHIAAVLDTETSEEMEKVIDFINNDKDILNVGITYLNTEDEAGRMAEGEALPKPFGFRKTAGPMHLDDEDT